MPASTEKQANTAKLDSKDVTDAVKQMVQMSDEQLKDFMTVKEGKDMDRQNKEKAIDNKLEFLSDVVHGFRTTDGSYEETPVDENVLRARNELKIYLPKLKQELKQIINSWFAGDPSVGVPDVNIDDLDDDDVDEINNEIDRLFAKYDLAKYMVNLNENTTACIAVPDMPMGMVKRKNLNLNKKDDDISIANQLESEGDILKESEGGAFKYTYKLDKDWFEKFKEANKEKYEFYYDKEERLYLIYDGDNHILSYNTVNNNVFTDKNIQEINNEYTPEEHEKSLIEQIERLSGKKITLI